MKSETEIAAHIVEYLLSLKWEVYQEVEGLFGICDIVAVQGPVLWAIEVKKTVGLPVIEQAARWKPFANYISIGVPRWSGQRRGRGLVDEILRWKGIGRLNVLGYGNVGVREVLRPKINRRIDPSFRKSLVEEMKTFSQAGTNGGKRWTPFKARCKEIRDAVSKTPGCTTKELYEAMRVDGRSSPGSPGQLRDWVIRWGWVEGVEGKKNERGRWCLFPKPEEEKKGA